MLLSAELSNLFVVCLGIGVVFIGLVCLIIICKIMGYLCTSFIHVKKAPEPAALAPAAPQAAAASAGPVIKNRQEFVAAIAAAIAEDMGTDVSRIRIHSIKRL